MKSAFEITTEDILTVRAERAQKNKQREVICSKNTESTIISKLKDSISSIFKTEVHIVTNTSVIITDLSKEEINDTWKRITNNRVSI